MSQALDMTAMAPALSAEEVWERFLAADCNGISRHVLDTWLRPVRCVAIHADLVTLEVQDQFFRDWLTDHYVKFIIEGLGRQLGSTVRIAWQINDAMKIEPLLPEPPTLSVVHHVPTPKIKRAESNDVADTAQDLASPDRRDQLNERYLFENFVAGPSNDFAYAACKAVAENPGTSYNPLFLFGGVGLGKTHLVSAIGHHIRANNPNARIVYVSAEQFTNDVVQAVLTSKLEGFRDKYRRYVDAILIDDIQLIAGKERTQHEFFHIFNALYDSKRQIIVTSDKLPHEIPDIEERLRSRFQWGLVADIQPPELETRVAILRKKALAEHVELSNEVTFFLAESVRSNVRELEGALVRLLAHASMSKTPITVDYVKKVLGHVMDLKQSSLSMESIQRIVAEYFHVRVADLNGRRRVKAIVLPRQVAMYLCRKHTDGSFPEIGSRFGKDHTTIMSACEKIDSNLKLDPELRKQILDVERLLEQVQA